MKSSTSTVAGLAAIKLVNALLGFATVIFLARLMGPAEYGAYAYVFVFISAISIIFSVGIPRLTVRETAYAKADADWRQMSQLWGWGNRASILISLCVLAVVLLGTLLYCAVTENSLSITLMVSLLWIPAFATLSLRSAALQGLGHVIVGNLSEHVIRQFLFLGLILLCFFATEIRFSAPIVMAFNVAAVTLAYLVSSSTLRRLSPEQVRNVSTAKNAKPGWWSAAGAMAITAGMNQINNYTDILVLGMFWPEQEVGYYRVAYQFSLLAMLGLQAASMYGAPKFAKLYREREEAELQKLVLLCARGAFLTAFFVTFLCFVFGEELLRLSFGPEFAGSINPMLLLLVAQLINAFFGPVGMLLNMSGFERTVTKGMFLAAVANILLNLLLVPTFGMIGAATATLITLSVWNIALWRAALSRILIDSRARF